MGNPGVLKGGNIVMLSDVNRMRPRAYLHRHKLHEKPTGWKASGPLEVIPIMEKVGRMVMYGEDTEDGSTKKLFRAKPDTTWYNYFSGDHVMDWLGQNGFGATMTCRRDRLTSGVPNHFLHLKNRYKGTI